ncbi:MAG: hypothetical protein ACOYBO_09195 [Azonexus sp.]
MARTVATVLIAFLIGSAATYGFVKYHQSTVERGLLAKLLMVEEQLTETKKDLLGYTKFTDYLAVTKSAVADQMKFLAARVDREYAHVEHIQKSKLGFKSDATIIVNYAVEYSIGYDLRPESFSVSGDEKGITVTLHRPEVVASPAVRIISHEIPSKGILIDEKAAVIALDERLHAIARDRARAIRDDEAVIALCEKKLRDFLHDFLAKQPNVRVVPVITFAYK